MPKYNSNTLIKNVWIDFPVFHCLISFICQIMPPPRKKINICFHLQMDFFIPEKISFRRCFQYVMYHSMLMDGNVSNIMWISPGTAQSQNLCILHKKPNSTWHITTNCFLGVNVNIVEVATNVNGYMGSIYLFIFTFFWWGGVVTILVLHLSAAANVMMKR